MIGRRLLVCSDSTIADLHYTVQIVMGWSDSHLHQFRIHGKAYGVAQPGGLFFEDDPEQVHLADFGFRAREWFLCEYDFNDHWQHEVRIEQILALDSKRIYPACIAGQRAGPPEDCGGPRAFLEHCQDTPSEVHRCLQQIIEASEAGDWEAVRDQVEILQSLRPWLALDRFDRRSANRRLRDYAQGERQGLFAQPVG